MTRVLIADDEEALRDQLAQALQAAWPEARIVARAQDGADAWDLWLEHQPDACFLDIRMPGLSGLEVAQKIAGRCPVVFVTAFGDHALQAFDAGAVDYLVKPVEAARLAQTVDRLKSNHRQSPSEDQAQALQHLLSSLVPTRSAHPQTLQASVGKEIRVIRVSDVIYFESDSRYTRVVYREDGELRDALLRTPLKELLAQLDTRQFQQIHRSTIVAQNQIASAVRDESGGMTLRLRSCPDRLMVSRPFQMLFKGQ